MFHFNSKPGSGSRPGPARPRKWHDLITRMLGLPQIDPLDEVTGLPPQSPSVLRNPNLW